MTQKTIEALMAQQGQQIVDLTARVDEHIRKQNGDLTRFADAMDKMGERFDAAIRDLHKKVDGRLPVWATVLFGVLMAVLGWSIKQ